MDEPQRRPGPRERDALAARIRRVTEEGRIGTADRDIRLGNVASAQTMAELDLMARDLDQLEAALPAGSATTAAPAAASPLPLAEELADQAVGAAPTTARSLGVVTAVVLALVLVGAAALGLFAMRTSSSSGGELFAPATPSAGAEPADQPGGGESPASTPAGPAYELSGAGIRAFLAEYRAKFGTDAVVGLTLYDDYAVVQVPQGDRRHTAWVYRRGAGWSASGGISANFPGSRPVDLARIDVAALVRNIGRARRTLQVEDPTTTYVNIDHRPQFDAAPNVNIYVSNEFHESGYLATRPDGTVERAYPFSP